MRVSGALARLPRVPLRHWVLVPPARWARVLPSDPEAAQRFRRGVVRRVVRGIEKRAREELGHGRGRAGAMAVLHTVGADLRPRAHVHVIATDGVFVPASRGAASFVSLKAGFGEAQLRELAREVHREAREVVPEPGEVKRETPGVRVPGGSPPPKAGHLVEARGAEVFVGEALEAHDRQAAERLAAYVTRPAVVPAAVRGVGTGEVEVKLREPARDGAVAVRVPEAVFEQRVAAAAQSAPKRPVSLHGVLAPGSSVRWRGDGEQLRLVESEKTPRARVAGEVERGESCPCGGRLEVVGVEEEPPG